MINIYIIGLWSRKCINKKNKLWTWRRTYV